MSKAVIVADLAKHLDQKIKTAMEDFVDLCARTDIDERDMLVQVITLCSHYAAMAAIEMEASEQEYLKVCHHQYKRGRQCLTQATSQ